MHFRNIFIKKKTMMINTDNEIGDDMDTHEISETKL